MKFRQITKKTTKNYKGDVYDLTVKDAHSYNIDGLMVHNSGAGSLVNWALDITQVNPLKYDLIFDRFLNAERGHLPDIDSDFCIVKGSQVFEHLNKLYGKDHCCNIVTFSNLQAKAIVKDVCRVFEIPVAEVNAVTKLIPDVKHFEEVLEVDEVKRFFNNHQNIYKYCNKLYGTPRHHSQHPAGICVTPMPITDLLPVELATPTINGMVGYMAQFEKEQVEMIGAVKLDILRLKNITTLYDQMNVLKEYYGKELKLEDIPLDDELTWDLICSGDTMGIFQMASNVGKGIIQQIQPRDIEELSAVNAFVRPGTSGLEEYCLAKKDPSKMRRFHPLLDEVLEVTKGGIVYQEQIMSLISILLGVSFGRADIYRRALEKPNKKGNDVLVKEFEEKSIIEGMKKGIDRKACEDIRKAILDNCAYLFNKSHSIAYSYISYWTAWVKANYPLVFYVSLFNTEAVSSLQQCMAEARRHGITIAPPNVSKSKFLSSIEDKENNIIRIGMNMVKGVGEKAVNELLENQPYENIQAYLSNAGKGSSKTAMNPAIKVGALEGLPLLITKSLLKEDTGNLVIKNTDDENIVEVYLNREQQEYWYASYLECKENKSIPCFAIDYDSIKGKYLDCFNDGDLIVEKDNTLIVPETHLMEFGLTEDEVINLKTRKKPKGILKPQQDEIKMSLEEKAFIKVYDKIITLEVNKIKQYMNELKAFELSFTEHPLAKFHLKSFSEYEDGKIVRTAGIIIDIINRKTKTGKDFKNIILLTPDEQIRLTVWNNIFLANVNIFVIGKMVKVKGKKGFGGITVEEAEGTKTQ